MSSSSVNEQKKTGTQGKFGHLQHGEAETTLPAHEYTNIEDLPPVMVSVQLEEWRGDKAHALRTIDFDAKILLAKMDAEELEGLGDAAHWDGIDEDDFFHQAVAADLVEDWDGPFYCEVNANITNLLSENEDALAPYLEANLDPDADFIIHHGNTVDRNELIRTGLLDGDGTEWAEDTEAGGRLDAKIQGHTATIQPAQEPDDQRIAGYKWSVMDGSGPYAHEVADSMDNAKKYAKQTIAEARAAGHPKAMPSGDIQGHGPVAAVSRLAPGVNAFTLEDGTHGARISQELLRRMPVEDRRDGGIYVSEETQLVADEFWGGDPEETGDVFHRIGVL